MASIIGYRSRATHFGEIQRMIREYTLRLLTSSPAATHNYLSIYESVCSGYPVPFADEIRFRIIVFAMKALSLRLQTSMNEFVHKA
jgi:hypothetical protein